MYFIRMQRLLGLTEYYKNLNKKYEQGKLSKFNRMNN